MDALSDVMSAVRLTSNVFLDARFSAPWCIASQIGPEDCLPYGPMPAQIIAYHYLVSGRLFLQLEPEAPIEVTAGEVILMPRNDRHALGSAPGLEPAVIDHLIQPPSGGSPAVLSVGGGGDETHVICGYMGCELPDNPLLAALPRVLRINTIDNVAGAWISESFRRAVEEFAGGGVGSTTVLSKLAELLFVEAVRRYLAGLPEDQTGWLAGLRDAKIGKALAMLHTRPAHAWTTDELATAVSLSRSAFAERFSMLVGMPPMRYLTRWRLQLAAVRLRESPRAMGQIAFEVGYESEAAFSRAFKSAFGFTPGDWRNKR
ncbi:MAG: AraC family transcriptional regulator [Candidatus Thiodiazotropha sp.]|nr:AraC family transcriptional regulator [Candidatus Thiodiazotropha sp. (ex Lucina pensylvanica)]MBV2094700.1 AraC family transcriptional regulator [Candidatus Thiodiazotropha sp. (ex Codakia orbicularis)]PUB72409.1 MAG: AraC family transcriptional regulator [gamma proteobacterium symbiont of Ctena orbiculata]PUB76583.1 MAG: AraC family transcriptional regulator [gamma proteobacterium symbiont of Ctena orbiculata]